MYEKFQGWLGGTGGSGNNGDGLGANRICIEAGRYEPFRARGVG